MSGPKSEHKNPKTYVPVIIHFTKIGGQEILAATQPANNHIITGDTLCTRNIRHLSIRIGIIVA